MKRLVLGGLMAATSILISTGAAFSSELQGRVLCMGNKQPLAGVTIKVVSTDKNVVFSGSALTDANGFYALKLSDKPTCYIATAEVPEGDVAEPSYGYFEFCMKGNEQYIRDWLVKTPKCDPPPPPPQKDVRCWMTGGGEVFLASGKHSYGGNVNPGCSPTAGQGGQWNHVAHGLRLHFQGTAIQVIRCGNVEGIPAGSTSPKTPVNFIEFKGTGRLKGVSGNKANYPKVYFFGRVEDRGEPGSKGQRDPLFKDRYFLHVYLNANDPNGSTLLLIDGDSAPATVDPIAVATGNLQIHITSCDKRGESLEEPTDLEMASGPAAAEPFLAAAAPNPATERAIFSFGLPRGANVSLDVFDVLGRHVTQVAGGELGAGTHRVEWNLNDDDGQRVRRGIYFARLVVDGRVLGRTVAIR